jgi:hypothetical protein
MSYKIIRHFFDDYGREVVETGLTLKEAKQWCSNPETSSRTCSGSAAVALTLSRGHWFDGYDEE